MDQQEVRALLDRVAGGEVSASEATERLAAPLAGVADLGFARVDTHRGLRTGDPEVVYGAGKTPEQTRAVVETLIGADSARPALVTRADAATVAVLSERFGQLHVEGTGAHMTVVVGELPEPSGLVAVLSAGTSDAAVAGEAALTARAFGAGVVRIDDVGVAGLHRVLTARAEFETADCLVVVAGMEGALPSVVGGLTGVPLVAVPTSVGYGANFGGLSALLGMLNSCAPGVAVCNIDNGFGAGVFAARVARRAAKR